MAEFRTDAGLIDSTPMLRTASGLVECAPQFRTGTGLIDCGTSGPLVAVAEPSYVSGARSGASQRVYTRATLVSASGGKAPYSFAWAAVAGWLVTSPSSANASFSSILGPGSDADATFDCTVTDARGDTVIASVNAAVFNYGGGGGVIP
jgi:hypothetical protein